MILCFQPSRAASCWRILGLSFRPVPFAAEPDGEPIIGAGAHPTGQFLLTDRTPGAVNRYIIELAKLFLGSNTTSGGFSFFYTSARLEQ
jgi:hypothetical protein